MHKAHLGVPPGLKDGRKHVLTLVRCVIPPVAPSEEAGFGYVRRIKMLQQVMECFSDAYSSVLLHPRFGKLKRVTLYQVFGNIVRNGYYRNSKITIRPKPH